MSYYTDLDRDLGDELEAKENFAQEAEDRYVEAKAAETGKVVCCAWCSKAFRKKVYQQAFHSTQCKDQYHNYTNQDRRRRARIWNR